MEYKIFSLTLLLPKLVAQWQEAGKLKVRIRELHVSLDPGFGQPELQHVSPYILYVSLKSGVNPSYSSVGEKLYKSSIILYQVKYSYIDLSIVLYHKGILYHFNKATNSS